MLPHLALVRALESFFIAHVTSKAISIQVSLVELAIGSTPARISGVLKFRCVHPKLSSSSNTSEYYISSTFGMRERTLQRYFLPTHPSPAEPPGGGVS